MITYFFSFYLCEMGMLTDMAEAVEGTRSAQVTEQTEERRVGSRNRLQVPAQDWQAQDREAELPSGLEPAGGCSRIPAGGVPVAQAGGSI